MSHAPQPPNPSSDDESNPFVAFRKYADAQISSFLQNTIGLPTDRPNPGRWTHYDDWMRRSFGDWTSPSSTFGTAGRSDACSRDTSSRDASTRHHPEHSEHCPQDRHWDSCPMKNDWPFSFANAKQEENDDLLFGPSWRAWLRRYLDNSKYSPNNLDGDNRLAAAQKSWHRAFEDLLAAQAGLEMETETAEASRGENKDKNWWAMDVQKRFGGHPPRPSADGTGSDLLRALGWDPRPFGGEWHPLATRSVENDAEDEGPQTELEMYERFLGGSLDRGRENTHRLENTPGQRSTDWRGSADREAEADRQENTNPQGTASSFSSSSVATHTPETQGTGIVSTLTTTEKVTMPDGTTTTKVVLKKRFADGREESNETVHTANGRAQGTAESSAQKLVTDGSEGKAAKRKADEKKGWFWS